MRLCTWLFSRSALIFTFALTFTAAARTARAQIPMVAEPTRRYLALDLDLGGTRQLEPSRTLAFGRLGLGLGWFDGQRVLGTTVEAGVQRGGRATLGVAAQLASVQSGLGATATVMRDLTEGGFGAGLGVGFSFLHLQAQVFQRGPGARSASLFLRVPLGLLFHVWRSRRGP